MGLSRQCFTLLIITIIIVSCKKNMGIPMNLSIYPIVDTIGGTVTITGSGFSLNASDNIVMFNDTSFGIVLTASTTQLTVVVPGYCTQGHITVKNKSMVSQTSQVFTIAPKFNPPSEGIGYSIAIATGGGPLLSDYKVSFNGTLSYPAQIMNDILTVPVPAGASSGKITVFYKGQPYTSLTDFFPAPVGTVSNLTGLGNFFLPTGLAFDKNGNLFMADLQAGYIYGINTLDGSSHVYAGNGSFNFNGGSPLQSAGVYGALNMGFTTTGVLLATNQWYGPIFKINADSVGFFVPQGKLLSPGGLFIDGSDNVYITDAQKIKLINSAGSVFTIAGQATQGFQNGPIATASFTYPSSLVLDAAGNIYVADNNIIRLISNGMVSTFAGGGGNGGYSDGNGSSAGFINISSLAIDTASGNIYVTDPGSHLVRRITSNGVVTTIAGNPGIKGIQNGIGAAASFQGPWGIALDKSGNIYVSDGVLANSSIRKIQVH